MARQYVITEEEMRSLLNRLELKAMQGDNLLREDLSKPPTMADVHRAFHYVAVRWMQSVGFSGLRD